MTMQPPEGYLVIERDIGALKATNPEDGRIWVRDFDDDDKGSRAFWMKTLEADFVKNRGYTLVSSGDGEMVLESTVGGRPFRELIVVSIRPGLLSNTIRVVEFVAEKAAFERDLLAVRAAIGTVR